MEEFAHLVRRRFIFSSETGPIVLLAAQFGSAAALRTMINYGAAEIDARNAQGYTPLMLAARNGHERVVSLLLQAGADLEPRTPQGETLLMLCGQNGHTEALRALLQHGGIDVNAQNRNLDTALMLSAREGHLGTLIALVHAQPRFGIRNVADETAWDIALKGGDNAAAHILEAAQQALKTDETPLMRCVVRGHTQAIQALIQHGRENINARHPVTGLTALMVAAGMNDVAVVRDLLKAGALPNFQGKSVTALDFAEHYGHADVVTALIKAGAAPSARSRMSSEELDVVLNGVGRHVRYSVDSENVWEVSDSWLQRFADLHRKGVISGAQAGPVAQLAASFGRTDILRTLISQGADIYDSDPQGYTPLMLAARNGFASAVSALLEVDVNAQIRTPQGETLLMLCGKYGCTEALRALLQYGGIDIDAQQNETLDTALMLSARSGQVGTVIALIEAKADMWMSNLAGDDASMIARLQGNNTAEIILDAALQAPATGDTHLMLCVRHGQTEAIRALIQHSDEINTQNPLTGETALMIAADMNNVEVLRDLLQGGAQPNIQAKGRTALDLAVQGRNTEAVAILTEAGALSGAALHRAEPPHPQQLR